EKSERPRIVMCRFDPDWFDNVTGGESWSPEDMGRYCDMNNLRIEQAIQRLGVEAMAPGFASNLLIESLSTVLAVELSRHFRDRSDALRVRTRAGELSQADLQRIYDFVESFNAKCPSISDIAAVCDISPAHLRRSFKNTTGQTVHQYVEGVRLKKAK